MGKRLDVCTFKKQNTLQNTAQKVEAVCFSYGNNGLNLHSFIDFFNYDIAHTTLFQYNARWKYTFQLFGVPDQQSKSISKYWQFGNIIIKKLVILS